MQAHTAVVDIESQISFVRATACFRRKSAFQEDITFLTLYKILIFRIGELGDTLIALPAFRAVRRAFPHAELTLLGAESVGRVAARGVLPAQGLIDQWLSYPSSSKRSVIRIVRLWATLRREKFDTLVYLAPRWGFERRVKRDLRFFRAAGIRYVVGHEGHEPIPTREGDHGSAPPIGHEADHLLHRLAAAGIETPADGAGEMDMALTPDELESADRWLNVRVDTGSDALRLVALGPGSKWSSKIWPTERFAELGRSLIDRFEVTPLVLGGPEDRPLAQRLIAGWGSGICAAGELSVRESAAVLRRSHLYVGNDTGTMHLAAAVGTRCVAIMSAQDWPGRWDPYGPGHIVLRRPVPCAGCMKSQCPLGHLRCLTEISVETVLEACGRILSGPPTG